MKKRSLVALNGTLHSVFAMREREEREREKKAVLRILFAVVTPRLLQLPSSPSVGGGGGASCD